jgi:hypothetical protein
MREDIVRGLKNAIERGEPLEKAVQSFINAGYNPVEVKRAAEDLTGGTTAIINSYGEQPGMRNLPQPPVKATTPQQIPLPAQTPILQAAQVASPLAFRKLSEVQPRWMMPQTMPRKKKNTGLIITLIIILLLLVGGLIYMILYGQEFLNSLLGA